MCVLCTLAFIEQPMEEGRCYDQMLQPTHFCLETALFCLFISTFIFPYFLVISSSGDEGMGTSGCWLCLYMCVLSSVSEIKENKMKCS